MSSDKDKEQPIPIVHACYAKTNNNSENFVPHHIFSYQISGSMIVNDGKHEYVFEPGDFRLSKRNQLAKYVKVPPPNGEFKTIAIYFDQQTLREFSATYGYKAEKRDDTPGFINLPNSSIYKNFVESLLPYLAADQFRDKELLALKIKEALLILLRVNPELKDVLFDFSEPGKIDLEGFMQKNFHFKVGLNRFAYLTGRSLATFKRDFQKIFKTSPSRWLVQRRLQEAHYLIKEQGKRPSEIYFELGFEDFSHFTYAFRQAYGAAPTKI
ncbi:MAG: AraC family transcriptional regulator [Mucilaginibacter sp.]|uniref:helix-turn-helix domain-containing protein n=1 Tax=Mucilaginibacter sp. TaxID=1882438 RepID=UPI0031B19D9F